MKTITKASRQLREYKAVANHTNETIAQAISKKAPRGPCSARMAADMINGHRRPSLRMAAKIERLTGIRARDWFE